MIPIKTDEELKQIAVDLFSGKIFTDRHVRNPKDLGMVFMLLVFTGDDFKQELLDDPPGMIYEYLSEAGPRSVNGMPTFFSMRMLNEADTKRMFTIYERVKAAMEAI